MYPVVPLSLREECLIHPRSLPRAVNREPQIVIIIHGRRINLTYLNAVRIIINRIEYRGVILIIMSNEPVIHSPAEQPDHRPHLLRIRIPAAVHNDQSTVVVVKQRIEHSLIAGIIGKFRQSPFRASIILIDLDPDLDRFYNTVLFRSACQSSVADPVLPILSHDGNPVVNVIHKGILAVEHDLDRIDTVVLLVCHLGPGRRPLTPACILNVSPVRDGDIFPFRRVENQLIALYILT